MMLSRGFLLAINIVALVIPFYGFFYLDWNAITTVLLYVFETLIILLCFEVIVIARIKNFGISEIIPGIILLVGVGIFCIAQILVSTLMYGEKDSLLWTEIFHILLNSLIAGIFWIFLVLIINLLELRKVLSNNELLSDKKLMDNLGKLIGGRLMMMQFTVLIGGGVAKITQSPAIGISVFLSLKAYLKLKVLLKENSIKNC